MARSDLLIDLVRSGTSGDAAQFRKVVETVIADERAKRHDMLAGRLEALLEPQAGVGRLDPSGGQGNTLPAAVRETWPTRTLDDLVLVPELRSAVDEFVEHQLRAEELRSFGLEPVGNLLLVGPPGCGKTSIAEAISNQLTLPLYTIRYEGLVSSYLGETTSRLAEIFDLARRDRCVLFFDELDTIGKERSDTHELGEIKRVVASLLLFLDDAPTYSPVIAATNHPDLIDSAAWRRFPTQLDVPLPTRSLLTDYFANWQEARGIDLGLAPSTLAKAVLGHSYAEAEAVANAIARRVVLDGEAANPRKAAQEILARYR